jgi:hypothetical protein
MSHFLRSAYVSFSVLEGLITAPASRDYASLAAFPYTLSTLDMSCNGSAITGTLHSTTLHQMGTKHCTWARTCGEG